MNTYKQIFYHIIFGTKSREPTLARDQDKALYKYIWGLITAKQCKLYRINGMEDHIHILSDLHPSISLANYVKDIKVASSVWMKETGNFPAFQGWSVGYAAITYSSKEKISVINYIKKQKTHHATETFYDEFKRLLTEHEIAFDERYLL